MAKKSNKSSSLPIHIVNGPNLNLLGTREPEIYGRATLSEIEKLCAARAKGHGLSIVFLQSNKEGELVDFLQEARTEGSAVIIHAAGYTHTAVAILDALQPLSLPVIEVHLSNPTAREDSAIIPMSPAATGVIMRPGRATPICWRSMPSPISSWEGRMSIKDDMKSRFSGKKPGIDAEAIRELSELLAETGLTEIEIEHNGARIRVSRAATGWLPRPPRPCAPLPPRPPRRRRPAARIRVPCRRRWWAPSIWRRSRASRISSRWARASRKATRFSSSKR